MNKDLQKENHIDSVISQKSLATSLWLRGGELGRIQNVSKSELISTCEEILYIKQNFAESVVNQMNLYYEHINTDLFKLTLLSDKPTQVLNGTVLVAENTIVMRDFDLSVEEIVTDCIKEYRDYSEKIWKKLKQLDNNNFSKIYSLAKKVSWGLRLTNHIIYFSILFGTVFFDYVIVDIIGEIFQTLVPQSFWIVLFLLILAVAFKFLAGKNIGISERFANWILKFIAKRQGLIVKLEKCKCKWDGEKFLLENNDILSEL